MMRALVCTGLTAGMFICLIAGQPLFLVFAFVLPWQLIAAVADPDNKKGTTAANSRTQTK